MSSQTVTKEPSAETAISALSWNPLLIASTWIKYYFCKSAICTFDLYISFTPVPPLRLTTMILSPYIAPTGEEVGQEANTQFTSSKSWVEVKVTPPSVDFAI